MSMEPKRARVTLAWIRSCLLAALIPTIVTAAEHQIILVNPGQNTDVYFEINLKGSVFLSIYSPDGGDQCAEFWWITWPFGSVKSIGRLCDSARLEIPGLSAFAVSAKLRVGGAKVPLKVVAAATEEVSQAVKVSF